MGSPAPPHKASLAAVHAKSQAPLAKAERAADGQQRALLSSLQHALRSCAPLSNMITQVRRDLVDGEGGEESWR